VLELALRVAAAAVEVGDPVFRPEDDVASDAYRAEVEEPLPAVCEPAGRNAGPLSADMS